MFYDDEIWIGLAGLFGLICIFFALYLAVDADEDEARELRSAPCSAFADYKLRDVPARCVKVYR